MINSEKLLIVIAGPTATGKTYLSLELAKLYSTEIISADSRQFYKEMKIGTAPPSEYDLNSVKHHFIGHLSIFDYYNVSKYETEAIKKIEQLFCTYDKLILVGGSGLYINAVLYGIDDLPDPDDATRLYLKNLYINEGIESLRKMLKSFDSEYYEKVDLKNHIRLIRALEVCLTTGKKISELHKKEKKQRKFNYIFIGLNRQKDELFKIICNRTEEMIKQGLVEEAKELYEYRKLNALNTVGYKEIFEYFEEKITLEKAIENIKLNTRKYAKRQLTWFRKIPDIKWFHPDEKNKIIDTITKF